MASWAICPLPVRMLQPAGLSLTVSIAAHWLGHYMTAFLTRLFYSFTQGHFSCKWHRQGDVHVQAKVSRQITCEESWLRLLAWELTPIMQHLHHSKLHSSNPSHCLSLCPCACVYLPVQMFMTGCVMCLRTACLPAVTAWRQVKPCYSNGLLICGGLQAVYRDIACLKKCNA